MNPLLGKGFMILTLIISVPAELLFLNWLHTIWHGSIRLTVPMLFTMGAVFVLGTITTDSYLHDTYFVVGHFHFTMAAASFIASMAAIYFWFPKMFGRAMDVRLGKIHFWGTLIFITLVFGGQLLVGYAGQQRRLWDPSQYTFLEHLADWNRWTSYAAFMLMIFQVPFILNFIGSMFAGKAADSNPWQVGTLEWSIPSPPPVHNYDRIPTVLHGPHEFSNPEVMEKLGKDWIGQAEPLPAGSGGASHAVAASPARA